MRAVVAIAAALAITAGAGRPSQTEMPLETVSIPTLGESHGTKTDPALLAMLKAGLAVSIKNGVVTPNDPAAARRALQAATAALAEALEVNRELKDRELVLLADLDGVSGMDANNPDSLSNSILNPSKDSGATAALRALEAAETAATVAAAAQRGLEAATAQRGLEALTVGGARWTESVHPQGRSTSV